MIPAEKVGHRILRKGEKLFDFSIAASCATKFDGLILLLQSHFHQIIHSSDHKKALALGVIYLLSETPRGQCIIKSRKKCE